jgi:hypothetical protein
MAVFFVREPPVEKCPAPLRSNRNTAVNKEKAREMCVAIAIWALEARSRIGEPTPPDGVTAEGQLLDIIEAAQEALEEIRK